MLSSAIGPAATNSAGVLLVPAGAQSDARVDGVLIPAESRLAWLIRVDGGQVREDLLEYRDPTFVLSYLVRLAPIGDGWFAGLHKLRASR